uniref:Uncharacterized protein n=1 Tax=Sipha flava TaxID=143950 RepID=A0A2S2QLL3_9HEMI
MRAVNATEQNVVTVRWVREQRDEQQRQTTASACTVRPRRTAENSFVSDSAKLAAFRRAPATTLSAAGGCRPDEQKSMRPLDGGDVRRRRRRLHEDRVVRCRIFSDIVDRRLGDQLINHHHVGG